MRFEDFYGPRRQRPDDVTASFECRQAVPSPCTGGSGTGTWSNHAYGLAIDINPRENPYVGCGQSNDPTAQAYRNRSRKRRGMVGRQDDPRLRGVGLGVGRLVVRQHQGLHALLPQRPLAGISAARTAFSDA